MFTDVKIDNNELSLKEQFLKELAINIKNATFKQTESNLRENLKKKISDGKLF